MRTPLPAPRVCADVVVSAHIVDGLHSERRVCADLVRRTPCGLEADERVQAADIERATVMAEVIRPLSTASSARSLQITRTIA